MQFFETPILDREMREDAEYEAREELNNICIELWAIMKHNGVGARTAMEMYLEVTDA